MIKNILFIYNQVRRRERKGLFRECIPTEDVDAIRKACLLYTSPSPRDRTRSRMPSSA